MQKADEKQNMSPVLSSILGSLSGICSAIVINPIEVVKTRMQVQGEDALYKSSTDCLRKILKHDGLTGLYVGVEAALLRQILYCSGRFVRLVNGSIAGGIGTFISAPTEIVLVRMMSDSRFPKDQRRNYKSFIDAFRRILKEEGFTTLFRGLVPTMYKGILLNMVQLGPYYKLKEYLTQNYKFRDNRSLQLYCGFTMGFFSSILTSPIDFAKSKLQEMKTNKKGELEYKGTIDVLVKICRTQGMAKVFSGFFPYFIRIGLCNVVTFIFLEEFTNIYFKYKVK